MGVTRTNRAVARATGASCPNWEVICMSSTWSAPPRAAVVLDVPTEGARGRELAELVPDHRLRHEDGDVLAAVVHGERVPEHVGDDRRAARPGADHVLGALFVLSVHLLEQVVVDERALLQAAWHNGLSITAGEPGLSASCWCAGGARSGHHWPCACACGPPACPSGSPGGAHRRSCPHHHRAGGRPGSWRHHGRSGACPSTACGRPCPS